MEEMTLKQTDIAVYKAIQSETRREMDNLVMIASENYASRAVIEAQANVMTNKYAEGYPAARYYGGCEFVDKVEEIAIKRAKDLFKAEYVNVQPHSGSQANMAVYMSFLSPGDVILGMNLAHGGHLTHGSSVSFSGMLYKGISYGLNPRSQLIDYDQINDLVKMHKPKMVIAGASAYPRQIDFNLFHEIAHSNGAYLMVDMAHIAGLIAANLHPSPVGKADFITSTTHKTLRGPRGGLILARKEFGPKLNKGIFPGIQGGPLMHVIAAKAVSFKEAMAHNFIDYQVQVIKNAKVLADELMRLGFDLISGGTDTHLLLVDLSKMVITGQEAERALEKVAIVANKNSIPFDKKSPRVTSGLRLGTPALTTRGMKEPEMKIIASIIKRVLKDPGDQVELARARNKVLEICESYPIYKGLMCDKKENIQ